ncbi:MAG: sigma-54 dependent transcriptional regulator [Planctomycetota bacterium]
MTDRNLHLLVVDDDRAHRNMLREVLLDMGIEVLTAENGLEALELLEGRAAGLVLLDMRMPVLDGLGTLAAMAERRLDIPTVVLTAHADLDDAVRAMKLGAKDYLRKPIEIASLQALVRKYLLSRPAARRKLPPLPEGVVFESPLMEDVLEEVARLADSDVPVLLQGETGTGKEILADLLHRWSRRSQGPLVAVNMAALPEALVESELFGHRKGAFTGADSDQRGRFQEACGGTLFLDEVGEMPLALQPKILRAVQSRRVARLGGGREQTVDFRLVSATNKDLEKEIEAGRFREDLYYRIAVVTIEVPPLRERREDLVALMRRFLRAGEGGGKRLSPAAESALLGYSWPGNIRELQNTMQRASILAAGDLILPENLPPGQRAGGTATGEHPSDLTLAGLEKRAILAALQASGGNRTEAARALGISRRKLLYRLKQYREQDGEEA